MLAFNFMLHTPFISKTSKTYFYYYKKLTTHKHFEFQIDKWPSCILFEVEFRFKLRGEDHAGLSLGFTLFNRGVVLIIYDDRHWDHTNNRWELYHEPETIAKTS